MPLQRAWGRENVAKKNGVFLFGPFYAGCVSRPVVNLPAQQAVECQSLPRRKRQRCYVLRHTTWPRHAHIEFVR